MIRVVFDASVIISTFPAVSGTLAMLIDRWRVGDFDIVVSEHIIGEVSRNWNKPYWRKRLTETQIESALYLLWEDTEITPITVQITGVATHPEDDLVLATAVSARVDYLVTSDNPFRNRVKSYQGIVLLSPREFLDLLKSEGAGR